MVIIPSSLPRYTITNSFHLPPTWPFSFSLFCLISTPLIHFLQSKHPLIRIPLKGHGFLRQINLSFCNRYFWTNNWLWWQASSLEMTCTKDSCGSLHEMSWLRAKCGRSRLQMTFTKSSCVTYFPQKRYFGTHFFQLLYHKLLKSKH